MIRRSFGSTLLSHLASAAVGCAPASTIDAPPRLAPAEPPGVGAPDAPPRDATTSAGACTIAVRTQIVFADPATPVVTVVAENVSSSPVDFDLPNRCPAGPIDIEGLPAGFDYYGTCTAGACPGPRVPTHVHLEPGARRGLATARFAVDGTSCGPALAPRFYELRPRVEPLGLRACVEGAALDLRGRVAPAPPPRPVPTSPGTPPPASGDPDACTSPADCVLSCPSAPGCCGWPCGCRHAIRRDHAASFEAGYASTCQRAPHCPAVGCAFAPAAAATCRQGRCVAVSGTGL